MTHSKEKVLCFITISYREKLRNSPAGFIIQCDDSMRILCKKIAEAKEYLGNVIDELEEELRCGAKK